MKEKLKCIEQKMKRNFEVSQTSKNSLNLKYSLKPKLSTFQIQNIFPSYLQLFNAEP